MAWFERKNRGTTETPVEEVVRVEDEIIIDLTDRSPRSGLLWKDLMVVSEIIDSGADLSKPWPLRYLVRFDTKKVADRAASRGRRAGYTVTLVRQEPGATHRWLATYEREVLLDLPVVIEADDFFKDLVGELGGQFDGIDAKPEGPSIEVALQSHSHRRG
jgi:hypothetical protein